VTSGASPTARPTGWEAARTRLVRWAGGAAAAVSFGTAFALHDPSAVAVFIAMSAALSWLWIRPRSTAAALVAVLVLVDVVYFMGTATFSNVRHSENAVAIAVPAAVAVTALVAFVAAVAVLAFPAAPRPFSVTPRAGALGGFATGVIIAVVLGVAPHLRASDARPGDLVVRMKTASYSPRVLRARSAEASVFVGDDDLFWHTFTIDALHVDVRVPVGGGRRVQIRARPGRYEYYCRVPGHRAAGMKGTLILPSP